MSEEKPTSTYIKTTQDGRVVEVIGETIYLGGQPETTYLIELIEHPNRQAIRRAVPDATHMAGRVPLNHAEAAIANGAMTAAKRTCEQDERGISERLRKAVLHRAMMEGVE